MRTIVAVFTICFLSLAELCRATTTTACYEGIVSLQETCTPTQYILIHSVESQEVSSCNDSSPGALWSRSGPGVHYAWDWCNLQKERCTTGSPPKAYFLRINYTCINELSSIRRIGMCSNVSEVTSTPVYLQSPGYPDYFSYTRATKCTCFISVSQSQTLSDSWLTLYHMLTQLPESLILKWSNGTKNKTLTTVKDNSEQYYIPNQETTFFSSGLSVSFVPNNTGPSEGYFWIGLESRDTLNIAITCNAGLGTSLTLPPTTATKNTSTTTSNEPSMNSKTAMATVANSSVIPAAVRMTDDDLKTIYIVVPTVVIAMIVIIVIVIIVKKRRKSNYTKSEDTFRLSTGLRDVAGKSRFAMENFAFDMVDNDIYESQGSLRNGSQSGPLSSYGVGLACGTFKGEKARPSSNEDLNDRGPGAVRDMHRRMNALPKSATFGGEDLLTGDGPSVSPGGGEVIYAQINKPKKNNNQEDDQVQGQTSIMRLGPSNERQDQVVSDSFPTENGTGGIYSLADDFDDPNEYFEYDAGSRSNNADDADDDYAYAYARRHARGSSKRREPQQSLHIYDDAASDDSEYAESDTDGVYDVAMDVQIELNDDETEGAEGTTNHDEFKGQEYKKQIDAIVSVQRTEL